MVQYLHFRILEFPLILGESSQNGRKIQVSELLLSGDWNHGILNDFPSGWE